MIKEQTTSGYHLRSPIFHYDKVFSAEGIEKELSKLFLNPYEFHDRPLVWFDKELKHNFGVDVYSHDFPKEKGYSIYRNEHVEALVLKLEKLNDVASLAFKEFLDIDSFELVAANIGNEKNTSDLYRQFLNSIHLPFEYIENKYNSRFAKHFYSTEELDKFRARWVRSPYNNGD
jgi:hypothetical protein